MNISSFDSKYPDIQEIIVDTDDNLHIPESFQDKNYLLYSKKEHYDLSQQIYYLNSDIEIWDIFPDYLDLEKSVSNGIFILTNQLKKKKKNKLICGIEEIIKLFIKKERIHLSASNGLLIQRKIVEILSKKENDPKKLKNSVNFYRVLSLLNNGKVHSRSQFLIFKEILPKILHKYSQIQR
jgi:hypothetical protein